MLSIPGKTDFSGMVDPQDIAALNDDPLYIGDVLQKAFLEVEEPGRAVMPMPMGVRPLTNNRPEIEITKMRVNRPFLFLVQDRATGTILFMGRIMDPRE